MFLDSELKMKILLKIKFFLAILLTSIVVIGQNNDTIVLNFDEYISRVKKHHPIAKQADLQILKGRANVINSQGGFDPKLFTDISQKYFDKKQYYSIINSGLKVPTWFGIELEAGYEQNHGFFLNPESNNPPAGLWRAGISVPIGRDLFIDERRAALKQAKIYQQSTEAERELLINELLYESGKAYWEWFRAYHTMKVFENALGITQERFNAVKQAALLGDKPSIDTLQASIQMQNRKLALQQAKLDFTNATALLSVYLWDSGTVPLEVNTNTIPIAKKLVFESMENENLTNQLDTLINNHPAMQQYRYKIQQLEIDKRLQLEQLKPQLDLKYNALNEPVNNDVIANYSPNNYKWGLQFGFPIFLRKERGKLKLTTIKIQETQLDMNTKNASMVYKARSSLNTWNTTLEQVKLYKKTVKDYKQLLAGEKRLFDKGESSLFLVNYRESSYLNAEAKLIELVAKNQKTILETNFSLGLLSR